MKRIIDLTNEEAREHFLKGSSYFSGDFPKYISFEAILSDVGKVLNGGTYLAYKSSDPSDYSNVNYNFVSNKDGRLAWRPYELMHPAIYVSLVNVICDQANWDVITARFEEFEGGAVECCSSPVMSLDHQSDVATQVRNWWQRVEQRSLSYSLEFSHVLHTDVTDCYGSLYTHSISWALHGILKAKTQKRKNSLLGNKIDSHIRASRYGQTNGISQGSALMDFIAELVLGFVDTQINSALKDYSDFRILRFRDDYRIFANNDDKTTEIFKVISDQLRIVGMKLGAAKTFLSTNVIEGSIKPDKLAGIDLKDLGDTNAKTIQKQLLRLHSFGMKYPNSGALKRLLAEFHVQITKSSEVPEDLEVQIAIVTDIGFVSPATIPPVAGILSHLISLAGAEQKLRIWAKVRNKMARVPYNGYLEIWLQRIIKPRSVGIAFISDEPICKIVNGETSDLWESAWIASKDMIKAINVSNIIDESATEVSEVISHEEIALFTQNAWLY